MDALVVRIASLAVAVILCGTLLTVALRFSATGHRMTAGVNTLYETRELQKEYRKFNAYDDRDVSGADVIAFILENQGGDVGVQLSTALQPGGATTYIGYKGSSTVFTPFNDSTDVKFKIENLQANIDPVRTYRATLVYSGNDTVCVVSFRLV